MITSLLQVPPMTTPLVLINFIFNVGYVTTTLLDAKPDILPTTKFAGYNKPTYPVLVGNYVRVYMTKFFAILPRHSKFMVKERLPGMAKVKLTLKCSFQQERFL